jgi:hypothetical protein
MNYLSPSEARKLIEVPLSKDESGIPDSFTPELIPFLFPVDHRPSIIPIITPPESPNPRQRTSSRRNEDEARRKAMHALVTNWDKSAKTIARQLVDVLFRGGPTSQKPKQSFQRSFGPEDIEKMNFYKSLIPDFMDGAECLFSGSPKSRPQAPILMPVSCIGGYTVTETVGPLSMITEVIRRKEVVAIWIKERIELSHGRRRARIVKKEGRIVLFDRYMNLVFVPLGNPVDCWQFVRGNVIGLIQRKPRNSNIVSPSASSAFQPSSQSSFRSG